MKYRILFDLYGHEQGTIKSKRKWEKILISLGIPVAFVKSKHWFKKVVLILKVLKYGYLV